MQKVYQVRVTRKDTGESHLVNTPGPISFTEFRSESSARRLKSLYLQRCPRVEVDNWIDIITTYVPDDAKYIHE